MPILFALGILVFAVYSIDALNTSFHAKTFKRSMAAEMAIHADLQLELGLAVRKAYDEGRNIGSCPGGTATLSGVGSGAFPLCWRNNLLTGRCFKEITHKGQAVCFAVDQTVLAGHTTSPSSLLAMILSPDVAFASGIREPAAYGDYSQGMHVTAAAPTVSGGPNARATVSLPPPDSGLEVRGNYIDCRIDHTDCFTIVFCLNSTSTCTGEERFASTFAVRYY